MAVVVNLARTTSLTVVQQANQLLCPDPDWLWKWKMKWDHDALASDHAAVLFLRIIGPTRQIKKLEETSGPCTAGYQACSGTAKACCHGLAHHTPAAEVRLSH